MKSKLANTALAAALMTVLYGAHDAYAQEANSVPQMSANQQNQATTLEAVAVTGSRIKRAELEGPAPVTVISAEQITKEGFATIYEALGTLTEVTGTVQADVNKGPTPNASPLNLRNLGPGRTLLLIDGRRVPDYPLPYEGKGNFANFNNIPISMVERIEVLASGGSAIYGSDAMAGVINVITKKNFNGNEVRMKLGTTTRGGGSSHDLSWVSGRSGDNWSIIWGTQWTKRNTLFAGNRKFMDGDMEPANTVKHLVNDPWPWIYGVELIDRSTMTRVTPPTGSCDRFQDMELHQYLGNEARPPEFRGQSCAPTRGNALWSLRNGMDNKSVFVNGNYDFANGLQGWANFSAWDGEGESRQDEALRWDREWVDAATGRLMRAQRMFTVPEAGGRVPFMFYTNERSYDLAVGLRGKFGDRFDWDATVARGQYEVEFSFPAVMQSAVTNYFFGPQLGTDATTGKPIYSLDLDRFWNPLTTGDYRSMTTHGHTRAKSWMNQAQFAVDGDLFKMPAGPVGFAAVLEAGTQGYELHPDPLTFGPQQQYDQPGGVNMGSGDRKRYAAGVEFKFPLLASLNLTTAGRYDHYTDDTRKEGNFTWNAGVEWRPIQSLLLRGSYSTTFRAPDMHYLFATSGTGKANESDIANCVARGLNPTGCGTVGQTYIQDIPTSRTGNLELESETGKSWTAGVVWDAMQNLSLSADYWRMTIDNQVQDFGVNDILNLESECRNGRPLNPGDPMRITPGSEECAQIISRVTRSAPGTDAAGNPDSNFPLGYIKNVFSGPINMAFREVAGVDVSARYRLPDTAWGSFAFAFNYTNQLKTDSRRSAEAPLVEGRDNEIRTFQRASISWEKGAWNATLFANRLGHVNGDAYGNCILGDGSYPQRNAECPTGKYVGKLKAPVFFNLSAGYRIDEHARINLYIDNLLDEADYKDPYKMFFTYANERVFSRVGREVSLEYVFNF